MKQFDDYWKENWNEQEWAGCERAYRLCYEDGVKTGMVAAADIAERMYFTHTPDDGVISGEGVADEIRKRANDI